MSWCQLLCFVLAKYCLRNEQARAGLMMMHHGFIYFFQQRHSDGWEASVKTPLECSQGEGEDRNQRP